uniref:Uncharacterized protein n=1 Tax=Arundo donax TaxID=35708 RepID=A0A0A9EGH8_ARUDO
MEAALLGAQERGVLCWWLGSSI